MLSKNLAFVDIETTGSSANFDRIIEIAIIRVENNRLVKTFQSLVNPQKYIPPEIERITGIDRNELENAPTFYQIKNDILEILDDCIFTAHNVRFDYGFVKNEFKRLDLSFSKKLFCTVKFSKYLFSRYRRHNLDNIIERFNIVCINRHRAYDDAKVIYDFYNLTQKEFDEEKLSKAFNFATKRPSLPIDLQSQILDNLPESPGVYIFFGDNNIPLYIGKSINIRERVLSHFASDHLSSTEMKISQQIKNIEAIETSGELSALFKESTLIKKLQPLYNRKLRLSKKLIVLKKFKDEKNYDTVLIDTVNNIEISDLENIMGIFKSKRQARDLLKTIAKENSLCEKILKLENTKRACFGYHLGYCKGACIDKEESIRYNMKFVMAFSKNKLRSWPFDGPIIIEEKNLTNEKNEAFLIDKWCYLGSIDKNSNNLSKTEYIFDLDIYKILITYLRNKKNYKNIKIISKEKLAKLGNII